MQNVKVKMQNEKQSVEALAIVPEITLRQAQGDRVLLDIRVFFRSW
jgi:hypothetical protein